MIDTKSLREKVLDLAIRGKLVPQDPNDEPASVLLERIREQKLQMVKEGKLKAKDLKNDTIIFKGEDNLHYEKFLDGSIECIEEDIPFDIPDSWLWVRFSTVTINRDSERKPISLKERTKIKKIYDYYGASGAIDKVDDYLFSERLLLIGEDGANLVTRTKPIAFFAEGKYWVNNHAHCIDATDKNILDFIALYINSINLEKYITGAAQPKMNQDNMNSILIPFPPIDEQMRISNYVNDLLDFIRVINYEKEELISLIDETKSKILDLAIRGQLVPQDPNDEPASALLERIRSEKEELIKQGKIKRDKKESIIFRGEDNSYYEKYYSGVKEVTEKLPFSISDKWAWERLGNISSMIQYGLSDSAKTSGTHKLLRITDIQDGKVNWETVPFTTVEDADSYLLKKGDIVFARTGATVGKSYLINELPYPSVFASYLIRIRLSDVLSPEYLSLFFNSKCYWNQITDKSIGSGQPNCNGTSLKELFIPLPTISEQFRIVQTVLELFDIISIFEKFLK